MLDLNKWQRHIDINFYSLQLFSNVIIFLSSMKHFLNRLKNKKNVSPKSILYLPNLSSCLFNNNNL